MKLVCLAILATAPLALEAITLSYTPIIFPGSPDTRALAINSSGTVLVDALTSGQDLYFTWKNGVFTPVPLPLVSGCCEGGINDNGAITGNYSSTTQAGGGGFILNSALTTFQVPGSRRTDALGINDSESVVGWFLGPSGTQGYIRSSAGEFSTINVQDSLFTEAAGINNTGDIVGQYADSSAGHSHGFLLQQGAFSDVQYPGTVDTEANGINDLGDIVGEYTDNRSGIHGFVLSDGVYSTLDFPGAAYTDALGINVNGSIVGLYGTNPGINGFIASPVAPVPEPVTLPLLAGCLLALTMARRLV
jgi:hypothetical protein